MSSSRAAESWRAFLRAEQELTRRSRRQDRKQRMTASMRAFAMAAGAIFGLYLLLITQ
ncbi:MAG: hypothetical protein U1D30_08080 [Planctomycetota bacterium]